MTNTNDWYEGYQPLVRRLPELGTGTTNAWYYHRLTVDTTAYNTKWPACNKPIPVIRDRSDYVRMSSRLSVVFAESISAMLWKNSGEAADKRTTTARERHQQRGR